MVRERIAFAPGLEMSALHDLYSRLTGIPTKEHYCPVGPLHPIVQWEARRFGASKSTTALELAAGSDGKLPWVLV